MKDLTGCLKKIRLRYNFLSLFLFTFLLTNLFFLLIFLRPTLGASDFKIYSSFEHTLEQESVSTKAIINIKSDTPRVLSYYTATIPLEGLKVECSNLMTGERLECSTFDRGSTTDILINLKNSVIRPEAPLELILTYSTEIVEKSSYNLSSSVLDSTINSVLIRYPKNLGEPLWTSDPIHNIRSVGENYEVLITKPVYTDISILFGEQLLYKFNINKVFSNSLNDENQTFELYVPSDTPTQTILWEEINPPPNISLKDEDGNYVFKYVVAPEETIDCNISGYIQMIEPLANNDTPQVFLTQSTGYWSINNATEFRRVNNFLQRRGLDVDNNFDNIENLDITQKELFYRYIYQYVKEKLNFEKDLPLGIGTESRSGADTLVESPNRASTLDFADFYIALLRRYNVPSRLVVGYISNITGYSADGFYHHWVEYLDSSTNKWVTADPFLDKYFEKDLYSSRFLDHIVILRRGKSAVAPKMSFFQESDFVVRSETEMSLRPEFEVKTEFAFEEYRITDPYLRAFLHISNRGNIAINNYNISHSNIENLQGYIDPVNNIYSQIILPKQSNTIQFNIPYSEIDSDDISLGIRYLNLDRYYSEETLEHQIEKSTPQYLSVLSKAISLTIFCVLVFLVYFSVITFKKKVIKRRNNG
jgi:hypothetical protein